MIIRAGQDHLLPLAQWHPDTHIEIVGEECRLLELVAVAQGSGALRRLIKALRARGLRIRAIGPFSAKAEAVFQHWGWTRRGTPYDGEYAEPVA